MHTALWLSRNTLRTGLLVAAMALFAVGFLFTASTLLFAVLSIAGWKDMLDPLIGSGVGMLGARWAGSECWLRAWSGRE